MTVTELRQALEKLEAEGHGSAPVVNGDLEGVERTELLNPQPWWRDEDPKSPVLAIFWRLT